MSTWHKVAKITDIASGQMKAFDVEDESILIINLYDKFYAIRDQCTHADTPLDGGEIEGDEIICPLHGARFCIPTGRVTAPPAYEDVQTFAVKVVDDDIFVGLE